MGNPLHTITGAVSAGFVLLVVLVLLVLLAGSIGIVATFVLATIVVAAIEITILLIP